MNALVKRNRRDQNDFTWKVEGKCGDDNDMAVLHLRLSVDEARRAEEAIPQQTKEFEDN